MEEQQLFEIIFGALTRFIYPQYTLAVVGISEAVKFAVNKTRLHPKFVSLGVGIVLGIIGVISGHLHLDADNTMRVINSFACAQTLYTYIVKWFRVRYDRISEQ